MTTDKFGGNKASEALYLLGLIERHGWTVLPSGDASVGMKAPPGAPEERGYVVYTAGACLEEHYAPTLIEALTEAANCNGCCGTVAVPAALKDGFRQSYASPSERHAAALDRIAAALEKLLETEEATS